MIAFIKKYHHDATLFLTILGLIGVFYSTAITTISLGLIVVISLFFINKRKWRDLLHDRALVPLILVFLVVLLSGVYTSDKYHWLGDIRVKLPFLLLPLAFFYLPPITKRFIIHLHYWIVLISVIVGIPVLLSILRDPQSSIDLIAVGQAVMTPMEHVKYSMTLAYAALTGIILLNFDHHLRSLFKRWLLLAVILLILLLHLMAVRTGLFIFYISVIIYSLYLLKNPVRRKLGVLGLLFSLGLPILSFFIVPTIQQKVGYVLHDWQQYQRGSGALYSDSERLLSYKAGISIFSDAPLLGVGYGDVRQSSKEYYNTVADRPDLEKLPHSQFLTYLAGVGSIGFLIWMIGFYLPLYHVVKHKKRDIVSVLLFTLYLNYTLSFLVENSLDRSMSVAFFLLIALPLIKYDEGGSTYA